MDAFCAAHRARRRFSTEDLLALVPLKISKSEAARRLGVTESAVSHRLRIEGIDWPRRRRMDDATFARLWACTSIGTAEIAAALGVTRQAVSWRARAMGLPARTRLRRKLSDDAEFRRLWAAGISIAEIARHFGYAHRSSVWQVVRRLGLPARQRASGAGTHAGWIGTISMAAYLDACLARAMTAEAGHSMARGPTAPGGHPARAQRALQEGVR